VTLVYPSQQVRSVGDELKLTIRQNDNAADREVMRDYSKSTTNPRIGKGDARQF